MIIKLVRACAFCYFNVLYQLVFGLPVVYNIRDKYNNNYHVAAVIREYKLHWQAATLVIVRGEKT